MVLSPSSIAAAFSVPSRGIAERNQLSVFFPRRVAAAAVAAAVAAVVVVVVAVVAVVAAVAVVCL